MDDVRRTKVHTRLRCKNCWTEGHILSGYKDTRISYECLSCAHVWEVGIEVCSIRTFNTGKGSCLVAFHGAWIDEEIKSIERCVNIFATKAADEWGFYRGKNVYTAWRFSGKKAKVVMAPDLATLIKRIDVAQGFI